MEVSHLINVLEETKKALLNNDSFRLNELSNTTIHSASTEQDAGSLTIAILVYSLSKVVERKDHLRIKNWFKFVTRFNSFIDLAIKAFKENKIDQGVNHIESARKSLTLISLNLKQYIKEVIRKACINKASKLYDHGISMGQTASLLGVTTWELAEYTGQTAISDTSHNYTLNVRERARMALEFLS